MKVSTTLNMLFNQIANLVLEKLIADPTGAGSVEGRVYYNTVTKAIRVFNGSAWVNLGSTMNANDLLQMLLDVDGAGSGLNADQLDGMEATEFALNSHSHTVADISDFAAAVDSRLTALFSGGAFDTSLDTIAEFTAVIDANRDAIANVLSIKRLTVNIGDGSNTVFTVPHTFNSQDVIVDVYENAGDQEKIITSIRPLTNNTVVITFTNYVPSTDEFRVVMVA